MSQPDATTLTNALEALPPFGSALAEATAIDAALVQALGRAPDAPLAVRALIRRGERQLVLGQEEAAATFAEAARRAMALGDADQMTPPRATRDIAAALKAKVVMLHSGHSLQAEAPDELLAALRGALA